MKSKKIFLFKKIKYELWNIIIFFFRWLKFHLELVFIYNQISIEKRTISSSSSMWSKTPERYSAEGEQKVTRPIESKQSHELQ